MGLLNLEDRLVFYGSYHSTPGNIALHMMGIPLISSTTLFLLASTTPPLPIPQSLLGLLPPPPPPPSWLPQALLENLVPPPTLAAAGALLYVLVYVLLDPLAGALLAPLTFALVSACHNLAAATAATPTATYVALALWFAAWGVLFVGHGAFEKRAPAMLDDFWGAIVLAPFFVWFECLFFCGYRKELRERVEGRVKAKLEVYREAEKKDK